MLVCFQALILLCTQYWSQRTSSVWWVWIPTRCQASPPNSSKSSSTPTGLLPSAFQAAYATKNRSEWKHEWLWLKRVRWLTKNCKNASLWTSFHSCLIWIVRRNMNWVVTAYQVSRKNRHAEAFFFLLKCNAYIIKYFSFQIQDGFECSVFTYSECNLDLICHLGSGMKSKALQFH